MRKLTLSTFLTLCSLPLLASVTTPEDAEDKITTSKDSALPAIPQATRPPERIRVIGSRDSGLELSSEKILKVPGAGNDPIRAIESLPGVVLANGFAPAVRGSSPNDMYYQTDGVPVGYVFHNDSYSSFHPNLIKSFELKTGAWESSFSDSIGGVIDTTLRDPEITEFNGVADFSFLRAGILVESKLTDTSAFYLAARQSLIHIYLDALLDEEDFEFTQAPINNDYQFKYINYLDDNNKIVVQATGANDDVGLLFSDDSTEVKQNPELTGGIGFETYYDNQSIVWTNESDYGQTQVYLNRLVRNSDFFVGQIIELDAITTDTMFKAINTQLVGEGTLNSGFELRQQNIDYQVKGKSSPCNNEFEVCAPSYYSPTVSEDAEIDINFINVFADYDLDLTDTVMLRVGGAVNNNDFNDETIAEPRVMLKWQALDEYLFKFSYGQHHQWFRQYKYLSETFGSLNLKQVKSQHYVIGVEYEGYSDWAWRIETYYKDMEDLIVSNPANQVTALTDASVSNDLAQADNYLNAGAGTAYGVEFLLNKAISNNWYGWLSIAYSKTERTNQLTGEKLNYEFDKPWIINIVSNYEFNDRWQLGGRWRFQSGSLYTPINGATPIYPLVDNMPDSSQPPIFYDPNEGAINSQRLDDFHRLDIRLDYKTQWWGKDTNVYFEILNAYGKQSLSGYEYNEDYSEKEPEYQFPESPIPSIGIQIEF
ncbi:hypothetical protein KO505_04370 [Psychrosphaera sp. F3M07]|uniref:TonB-dependent receptor plug domain-containing protein n=1 Tax=Psychrosphaera sp. F3M07 TaxID=2841560 RepID=UPI001C08C612|nr:hypothetical protein [Psychrosphaera sp. F3M07]MBU2917199.1 hypothetical protein [Psychrosphaera sp. F3M07]